MSVQFFWYVEGAKSSILALKESSKSTEDQKIFKEVLLKYTETIIKDFKENPEIYKNIELDPESSTSETIDKIINGICENNIYSRMTPTMVLVFLKHVAVGNYIKSLIPAAPDPPVIS